VAEISVAAATSAVAILVEVGTSAVAISVVAEISAAAATLAAAGISEIHRRAVHGKRMAVMTSTLPRLLSLLCLVCLASTVCADKPEKPIRDEAQMFHAAAIDRADQGIAEIRQSFDCGLFVRTIASVSPQPPRWFPILRTPRVNRMLEEQARTFADESGLPGIYVAICNRPRDVRVVVRPEGNAYLTRHDAETVRRTLMRDLHDKSADAALLALVDRVQDILQDHAERGSSPAVNASVLVGLLGGGLALWLLLRLIRRRIGAGSVSDRETQTRDSAVLLGTMFGFPAGLWIYDKLCPVSEKTPVSDAS
jgi:hypothetical protein